MLPDASRPLPFGQEKLGKSHTVDGLIGSMTHLNPYGTPTPPYGINPYGGIPYYPPNFGTHYPNSPTFLAPHPPQVGGLTTPQFMNPIPQQSMEILGYAQNHSYNPHCNEGPSTSYIPYGPLQHSNPYYPFPGPP